MFANTQMLGMNFAFPDVCLTPIPPVGPVPIPYPNMNTTCMGVPAAYNILVSVAPAHNLETVVPLSMGDNTGVNMGVASGMVMGPNRHELGSFNVLYDCMPATKMTSLTGQNGMSLNIPGMTIVPSQFQVLLLT